MQCRGDPELFEYMLRPDWRFATLILGWLPLVVVWYIPVQEYKSLVAYTFLY